MFAKVYTVVGLKFEFHGFSVKNIREINFFTEEIWWNSISRNISQMWQKFLFPTCEVTLMACYTSKTWSSIELCPKLLKYAKIWRKFSLMIFIFHQVRVTQFRLHLQILILLLFWTWIVKCFTPFLIALYCRFELQLNVFEIVSRIKNYRRLLNCIIFLCAPCRRFWRSWLLMWEWKMKIIARTLKIILQFAVGEKEVQVQQL